MYSRPKLSTMSTTTFFFFEAVVTGFFSVSVSSETAGVSNAFGLNW